MSNLKYVFYILGVLLAGLVAYFLGRRDGAPAPLNKETYDAIEEEAKKAGQEKEAQLSSLPADQLADLYPGVSAVRAAARAESAAVRDRLRAIAGGGGRTQ